MKALFFCCKCNKPKKIFIVVNDSPPNNYICLWCAIKNIKTYTFKQRSKYI